MPLLKREPDLFPSTLFELDGATHPWRVAHVRSRQEKVLARWCHDREIPFYLPLTQNEVITKPNPLPVGEGGERSEPGEGQSHNRAIAQSCIPQKSRIRHSYSPLFPGYVFVRAEPGQRVEVMRSNVVVNFLEVPDQNELAGELGQIHELQARGAVLVPFPWLTTGDTVRIRGGVFKGFSGVIVKEKGEERLVVSVSTIRRSVVVELGREAVVPHVAGHSDVRPLSMARGLEARPRVQ